MRRKINAPSVVIDCVSALMDIEVGTMRWLERRRSDEDDSGPGDEVEL